MYSSSQVMNLKSDIIYGTSCHVLDDWMMWKIRCAVYDSMIPKPTQFSHNIITSASCLCLKWLHSEISFCQKFVLFMQFLYQHQKQH